MALSMKQTALLFCFFGIVSFIFGVIAENKKTAAGTPITGKGVVICKYPSDPFVGLGYATFVTLVISAVIGYMSVFHPYDNKAIPNHAIFGSKAMYIFFSIAWLTTILAAVLIFWPTITQQILLSHTVHHNPNYACPTTKTGLVGGGAFVGLSSVLFWLVCLMLTNNARKNHFEEESPI